MSPTTSPFFNSTYPGQSTEQNLIDSLVIEQIAIYGMDVLYMPRHMMNLDDLLHESTKNAFKLALPMPMYLKSFSGYQNGMEMLTKFGVRSSDEITLVMSRSQWGAYYTPLVKQYHNNMSGNLPDAELESLKGTIDSRPKEGDLVFFPFDNSVFEIKYVMFDEPFFQLGRGYVYELQCEKFEFSGETIDTGYDKVDATQKRPDYYRMEFDVETGNGTFAFNEEVSIYDFARINGLMSEDEQYIEDEEEEVLIIDGPTGPFRLYKDPGFLNDVTSVTARVLDWNLPEKKLLVCDLSDLDPVQTDEDEDLTINKFDNVLIVGKESRATWITTKATMEEMAFDDTNTIQDEFDSIKIVDAGDENPFGFV